MISKKNSPLVYLMVLLFFITCKKDETTCISPSENEPENWVKSSSGVTNGLNDLHFYNNQVGIIGGDFGTVLKTNDGGNSWSTITIPKSHSFLAAFALSENEFFVGRLGLYKSNKSCTSFSEIGNTSSFGSSIYGVHFSDSLTGVMTKGGSIYTTNNGGKNWTNTYQQYGYANILEHTPDSTFYLSGGRSFDGVSYAEIHKSTDYGKSWTELNLPNELGQSQVMTSSFLSDSIGYVVTLNKKIFKTEDGGNSWNLVSNLDFIVRKVLFINATKAYLISSNSIYKSIDSGKNWTLSYSASANTILTDLESNGTNNLFVIDNQGQLYIN